MDTDGQQGNRNGQAGHAQTNQHLHQISDANEVDSGPSSLINHYYQENKEFCLSSVQFKDDAGDELCANRVWKTDILKNKTKDEVIQKEEEEAEEEFEVVSEISFLKDTSLTSSPSRNFKSSYAKSLADSYRRASLPVVVSGSKAQFYFKNEEFFSLNSNQTRLSDYNHDKFISLNSSDSKNIAPRSSEPVSLPTSCILDIAHEPQEKQSEDVAPSNIYHQLLVDGEMFIPYDRLRNACEENGGSFSLQDWHNFGSIITSNGRKLIKLSDLKTKWNKQNLDILPLNGHKTKIGPDKDIQVESLLLEREQSEGRIEHLCEVLADRDTTIQRLEEDLLRIRMECQRLIVDNRSLKSNLNNSGAQSVGGDSASEMSKLQQQVQLLTAQLNKAERSRHTYEAATRQLVDFLHTVNSTLNMTSNHSTSSSSAAASPINTLYSVTSPTITLPAVAPTTTSSNFLRDEGDGDPPYRLADSKTPSPDLISSSSSHSFGPVRRNSDAVRKSGSVWALPTQSGNPRRVSRALSTYCVASAASGTSHSNSVSSTSNDRGRALTSEFLATRAKELIANLKSLMRSDSVLKLNLEPKKSGSSVNRGSSTSRSMKNEESSAAALSDTNHNNKAVFHQDVTDAQNSRNGEAWHRDNDTPRDRDQSILLSGKSDASPEVNQNFISATTPTVVPRIPISTARENVLQTLSALQMNGNPQPLSLMVVGESSSTHDDHHFSSLPDRSRVSQTLNDSDRRLVWV